MNYLTEERKNALAAQYALGNLQGHARTRFKKLLLLHTELRHCVWRWESHLGKLAEAIPEETPSPKVWQRIEKRISLNTPIYSSLGNQSDIDSDGADAQKAQSNVIALGKPKTHVRWTFVAAVAASFFAVALAFMLKPIVSQVDTARQVAVVQSDNAKALWLVELNADKLQVQAAPSLQPVSDKDYELWMLAPDGRAPVSLGLLPKSGMIELERHTLFNEMEIATIAVSLEPLGGSPNGSPTEVLYTAELITL